MRLKCLAKFALKRAQQQYLASTGLEVENIIPSLLALIFFVNLTLVQSIATKRRTFCVRNVDDVMYAKGSMYRYFSTFTIKINQMKVHISYMGPMGIV